MSVANTRETQQAEKDILVEKYKTALNKARFNNEVKGGLGEVIKKNPKPKIIKKTITQRISLWFKSIFTKF